MPFMLAYTLQTGLSYAFNQSERNRLIHLTSMTILTCLTKQPYHF